MTTITFEIPAVAPTTMRAILSKYEPREIPNFPKPKPKLCFRDQIFRNRNRYFFSETKFSETKTETFFRDHILRNRYRNPPKIGKSLETETETDTSQYQFLERSSLNISPLLCFSSPQEKRYSPSTNIFLLFLLCFSFPPEQNVNLNVAVFAFLHLRDT